MSDPAHEPTILKNASRISSAAERTAYLNEACGEDAALRDRIEVQLASDGDTGNDDKRESVNPTVLTSDSGRVVPQPQKPSIDVDATEVMDFGAPSILHSLAQTVDVPRVALRTEDEDSKPQPDSDSQPSAQSRNSGDRYRLDGEIARGGMGAILKGHDTDLGRDLAIKVLLDFHRDDATVIQRFVEEAQIGGQLQHPGIAPVYELGQFADSRPFFSMKLVKGETLAELLKSRTDPSEDRSRFIGIFEQICQTMAYAHSRGVIHRDLKPANIMVGAFGEVQVMDWGLAKVLSASSDEKKKVSSDPGQSVIRTLRSGSASGTGSGISALSNSSGTETHAGSVFGTPAYMPPEQALGEIDQMDERADVFGLGAILATILTGKPPYSSEDGSLVFRMAVRGKLDDCFERLESSEADAELVALTKDCLKTEPVDRPRDAGVLAERITGYLESVESRLREAEVQRAAEAARADAEAAQAEAERQRAEAQSAQAKAERSRAEVEHQRVEQQQQAARKLRRLLAGLAAVALVALGTSFFAVRFWQDAEANGRLADSKAQLASKNEQLANDKALLARRNEATAQIEAGKARRAEAEATRQRNLLKEEHDRARRNLYFAEMTLAGIASEVPGGLDRAQELLGHWSPDTRDAALRGWEWFYLDSLARQARHTLHAHEGTVRWADWSPNSTRLATAGTDGTVRIWDAETGQVERTIDGHQSGVHCVAWGPRGERIATASADGTARIWTVANGEEVCRFTRHQVDGQPAVVNVVSWSPDGSRVASCGQDFCVRAWDSGTGDEFYESDIGGSAWMISLAWSPDGKRLAAGSWIAAFLLDAESGEVLTELKGHSHGVHGVAWSHDSDRVATAAFDGTVRIWKVGSGQQQTVLHGVDAHVYSVAWSPDDRHVAAGGGNRVVVVWNSATGERETMLRGSLTTLWSVAWSPDGNSIAATGERDDIRVWDVGSQGGLAQQTAQAGKMEYGFDPGAGGRTVTSDREGVIRVWERGSKSPSMTVQSDVEARTSHLPIAHRLSLSPDGSRILDGISARPEIRIRDAKSGEVLNSLTVTDFVNVSEVTRYFYCLDWSPDGRRVASSGWGWALVWDPQTGETVTCEEREGRSWVSRWSPTGDRVASAGDGSVRIWDPRTGSILVEFPSAGDTFDLCWSPDGRSIVTAEWDGVARIRDASSGEVTMNLRGHASAVVAVAWCPDGSRVVTGSADQMVKLWDPSDGQETLTLRGHAGSVIGVFWSADRTRLMSWDDTGSVRYWDAAAGFLNERAASTLTELDRRLKLNPQDSLVRRLRAEVHAREGDWDAARADFEELSKKPDSSGLYSAGWWSVDSGADQAPSFPDDGSARWFGSASNANGFVALPGEGTALSRVLALRPAQVALQIDPRSAGDVWLNGSGISGSTGPMLVSLQAGWNTLALRGEAGNRFVRWQPLETVAQKRNMAEAFFDHSKFSAAARLYAALLEEKAALPENERREVRLAAVRSAALAESGQSQGEAELDDAARSRLRAQIVGWLTIELNLLNEELDGASLETAQRVLHTLRDWIELPELARLRDGKLPREESAQFHEFRADARTLRMSARSQVRKLLTETAARNPKDLESAIQLADLLLAPGEFWQTCPPVESQSTGTTTITPQSDGTIEVRGATAKAETLTLTLRNLPTHLESLRLEFPPVESDSVKEPASFEVVTLSAEVRTAAVQQPLKLSLARAASPWPSTDGSQPSLAIDGDEQTAWQGTLTRRDSALFDLNEARELSSGDSVSVGLRIRLTEPVRIRISVSGDRLAIAGLLKNHPEVVSTLAERRSQSGNWSGAKLALSQVIVRETTDATLLARRAKAAIFCGDRDLARSDWLRAVELDPSLTSVAFFAFRSAEWWKEAIEFGQRYVAQEPNESYRWVQVVPVMMLGNDRSAYNAFCEAILKVPVDELEIEERGIKSCCLWLGIIDPDRLSDKLTAECLATGNHVSWFPVWGWGTRGLLALRQGEAESAVRFIRKAESLPPENSARAMNLAVLALAEHRLEHRAAARRALKEAKQVSAGIKRDHDWLIARILIEEAEAALADK